MKPPPLLVTDQTRCYGPDGREVDCAGSGQDAARAKSFPAAAQRFGSRDGLVFDRLTGACWTAGNNAAGFPLTWREARDFVRDMARDKAFGRNAWQLPGRRLLFSLISHQQTRPALPPGHPFRDIFAGPCWTNDSVSRLPEQAWVCHIGDGRLIKANKTDAALVWAVCPPERNGAAENKAPGTAGRFLTEGETARDRFSGLVWPREAGLFPGPLDWQSALEAVTLLNARAHLGRDNWRLPNIRELESLADLSAHTPALTSGHPFTGLREGYWSSTTSVYEPRYAWAFYIRDGFVGVGFKAETGFHLFPVSE